MTAFDRADGRKARVGTGCRRADDRSLGADGGLKSCWVCSMRRPTECAETLNDLRGIFPLVEVDGEEAVVGGEVQRRGLACSEEMRDILHLHEWHVRLLELDAGWRERKIGEPAIGHQSVRRSEARDRNAYRQRTVPSLSTSSKSPGGNFSPSVSSTHFLISLAACGVYRPRRNLRMSWSRDVTEAISELARQAASNVRDAVYQYRRLEFRQCTCCGNCLGGIFGGVATMKPGDSSFAPISTL